jgi:hypothetical protein
MAVTAAVEARGSTRWLTDVIGQIHTVSNGTYGAPRVTRS